MREATQRRPAWHDLSLGGASEPESRTIGDLHGFDKFGSLPLNPCVE